MKVIMWMVWDKVLEFISSQMDKNMKEFEGTMNKMETEYGLELMGMFMMVNLLMGVKKAMEFLLPQ